MPSKDTLVYCVVSAVIVGFLVVLATRFCRPLPAHLQQSFRPPPPSVTSVQPDVRVITDVPYTSDSNPKHKLDLYLPAKEGFPMLVFVHGGTWKDGDRSLYGHLGRFFASKGVGVAIPSYRLSPEVKCDQEVEDVAKVIAWAKKNEGQYGGHGLVVMGHSSGAHLAALVSTNTTWIQAEGLTPHDIQGVVCVSGIYDLGVVIRLAGATDSFAGLDKRLYSPINYVRLGLPPFLVMYAAGDYRPVAVQSRALQEKLLTAKVPSELVVVPKEDHKGIIIDLVLPQATHGQRVVDFVQKQARP